MIDTAHFNIRLGARHAQTLNALTIYKDHLSNCGRLPHQAQDVDAVALVEALAPWRLHGPIHLTGNPVENP